MEYSIFTEKLTREVGPDYDGPNGTKEEFF